MLDFTTNAEYSAIIQRAHQLRAQAFAEMVRSVIALFRRKPAVQTRSA